MPQITKGGKYIFGWSIISEKKQVKLPIQAFEEYNLKDLDKIILISGSKKTGGFCVSTKTMVEKYMNKQQCNL